VTQTSMRNGDSTSKYFIRAGAGPVNKYVYTTSIRSCLGTWYRVIGFGRLL